MHLDEVGGLTELVLLVGVTLGLELLEQGQGLFELVGKTLAVKAQVGGSGLGIECGGDG